MGELLDFSKPHVLRNKTEYAAAVEEVDRLLDADPPPLSEEYERLEFLSVLIQAYEDAHFPLSEPTTPQEAVEFMLEQKGLSRTVLAEWLGGETQTSDFLQGTLDLTLEQIGLLGKKLGIPADLLIRHSLSTQSA